MLTKDGWKTFLYIISLNISTNIDRYLNRSSCLMNDTKTCLTGVRQIKTIIHQTSKRTQAKAGAGTRPAPVFGLWRIFFKTMSVVLQLNTVKYFQSSNHSHAILLYKIPDILPVQPTERLILFHIKFKNI